MSHRAGSSIRLARLDRRTISLLRAQRCRLTHQSRLEVKRIWGRYGSKSGMHCRMHDLRHTFATRLAENGVPEATMLALMGHMSRAMLERYSHIRMAAKREAVAGVLRPTGRSRGRGSCESPCS